MKFSEIQQLLQEKFGIDHLADIARELDASPQAVSNWKARDRVPYKYVLKIRQKLEESDTRVSGETENDASESNQAFQEYGYPQRFEEDTISVTDILLVLAQQLKIIIITPIILCTLTIIYVTFIAKPVYESTAKIMSSTGGRQSQATGLAAQFGINLTAGQSEPKWVYTEIIKSRTLARAVIKRKFDTEKYGPQKTLLQILTFGDRQPDTGLGVIEIKAVNNFLSMVEVSEDLKTSIHTVTIIGPEPNFVSELNTVLIEELDKHQRQYNRTKTSETRKFIEERILDTRKDLEEAEEALKIFTNSNRRIENSPALQLDRQRLAREVSVLTGVFTTLKQQLETTKIDEVKESDYVIVLDPPEKPLHSSWPNKKLMVILAGLLGIALGIFLAFINEFIKSNNDDDKKNIDKVKSLVISNIKELIFLKRKKYNPN